MPSPFFYFLERKINVVVFIEKKGVCWSNYQSIGMADHDQEK